MRWKSTWWGLVVRRFRGWKHVVVWLVATAFVLGLAAEAPAQSDTSDPAPQGAIDLAVAGHRIRNVCTGAHEVIAGRAFTVSASVASFSSDEIRFLIERREGDSWQLVEAVDRSLEDGRATIEPTAGPAGQYRVRAGDPDGDTGLEGTVAEVLVESVQPNWERYPEGGVRLGVPWHRQQYRLTCEAAALRMAHNFHDPGTITGDLKALRIIGVDSRGKRNGRWGNPNRAFVGYYNGRMPTTGYGVHYGPVARAATRIDPCRPSLAISRPTWSQLAGYLDDGYPVIVWGAHRGTRGIRKLGWRAFDGAWVTAWSVEHTWVVVGFRGTVSNPTHFIVHDPSGGPKRTYSLAAFNGFFRYFRTGVVVRG